MKPNYYESQEQAKAPGDNEPKRQNPDYSVPDPVLLEQRSPVSNGTFREAAVKTPAREPLEK
jgi:hypothetical protein